MVLLCVLRCALCAVLFGFVAFSWFIGFVIIIIVARRLLALARLLASD